MVIKRLCAGGNSQPLTLTLSECIPPQCDWQLKHADGRHSRRPSKGAMYRCAQLLLLSARAFIWELSWMLPRPVRSHALRNDR
jgi:hypothetical protein